jgi:hypothetical protein
VTPEILLKSNMSQGKGAFSRRLQTVSLSLPVTLKTTPPTTTTKTAMTMADRKRGNPSGHDALENLMAMNQV